MPVVSYPDSADPSDPPEALVSAEGKGIIGRGRRERRARNRKGREDRQTLDRVGGQDMRLIYLFFRGEQREIPTVSKGGIYT